MSIKELIISAFATIVVVLLFVYTAKADKRTWSKSGSRQVLSENGTVVMKDSIMTYYDSNDVMSEQEIKAFYSFKSTFKTIYYIPNR